MQGDDIAARFARLLTVEQIEDNFFRGIATPGGRGRVFGGQIIGQALMAATQTVADDRHAHSLHAYFIRAGASEKPVIYQVIRDRDGGSFNTRRVVAIQEGEPILTMSVSFHLREKGLRHQADMPDVPGPDGLLNEDELAEKYPDRMPERLRSYLRVNRPVEIRPCWLRPPYSHDKRPPKFAVWVRSKGQLPDDPLIHRAGLAFASDMGLLAVSMLPHGKGFSDPDMRCASLDHSIWLHDDFRLDDWLLYTTDSPWAGNARGFSRGQIFTRDGVLVADTTQEGLIRQIDQV